MHVANELVGKGVMEGQGGDCWLGGKAVTNMIEKTANYLCRKLWSSPLNTYCIPQGEKTKETWG